MKVLLVDDEEDFLDQTKIFLEKEIDDLFLETSPHVEDALEKLKKEDYDAVISDYQMPGVDGLEFLKFLREDRQSKIPFIIFTGKGREDVAIKALNLGANRYIQKGGDPKSQYSVLADAVNKEVRSYKKEERLKESERTHREIFEKAGIPIFIHDIDTYRVINANEEAAELYGYSKDEIREKGVGTFSAGGEYDQSQVKEQIEKTLEEGPQTFIWRGEKKDGTKTWEEVKLKPAEIKGEKRVLAAIRDITNLKKVQNEKEKNLEELQFINDTIIQISRMDNINDICDFVGEQVHSVNEDSYIFVSLYDSEKEAITLRSATGLNNINNSISDLFDDIKGMSLKPDRMGEEKNLYTSGNLEKVPGGLNTLLADLVDEKTCKTLENMLNIKNAYTVGFALENEPYGGIIILKTDESDVEYKQAIETLTSHLSILLQHKQEEEKRMKIEKRYNALYERSFDAVYILDMEGDFIDANPRAMDLLGYSMDDIDSLTYHDIVPDEALSDITDAFNEVINHGAQQEPMEIKLKRKDGSRIWVEAKTHILYKNGKPHAFQGIARDITERKEIERQMKKKERAIQSSINGIAIADLNGKVNYVNDSLRDIWGFDDESEILGQNTLEFFYDKEKTQKAIEELIYEGEWKGELKGVKSDDTLFDVFVSANLIYDEDGKPQDILASIIDISESKRTERKIEKLHDITRKLERCENEDKVYEIAIEAAEKVLDFELCSIDVVEGENFVEKATSSNVTIDGTKKGSIHDGLGGKTYRNEKSYVISDLKSKEKYEPAKKEYRAALSVPIIDIGVFQAVSKEKGHFDEQDMNMAELLMDHVRETLIRIRSTKKQEFLHSLLRHDVKNKNQIVEGYLQLLQSSELDEKKSEFVDNALKEIRESQDILDKVKTLQEIEEEDVEEIDIRSPLKSAIESNNKLVEDSDIEIRWDEKNCVVKGGRLLEEMFFNIINNAINHSGCENIDISLKQQKDRCIISIEDDGKGIPDDEKEKVFQKGYKKGNKAGTGLGLHLAKTMIEGYGGSIELKDSKMGGAKFAICLKKAQ